MNSSPFFNPPKCDYSAQLGFVQTHQGFGVRSPGLSWSHKEMPNNDAVLKVQVQSQEAVIQSQSKAWSLWWHCNDLKAVGTAVPTNTITFKPPAQEGTCTGSPEFTGEERCWAWPKERRPHSWAQRWKRHAKGTGRLHHIKLCSVKSWMVSFSGMCSSVYLFALLMLILQTTWARVQNQYSVLTLALSGGSSLTH